MFADVFLVEGLTVKPLQYCGLLDWTVWLS